MLEMKYSEARASFADLFDKALSHRPTRIVRRRDGPAVLVSEEDLKGLLARASFSPEVLFEAGAVSIWLPELAIWGRGGSFAAAKEGLLEEIEHLLGALEEQAHLRNAPNIVDRLPWIFRLLTARSDAEREAILFAAPAAIEPPEPASIDP